MARHLGCCAFCWEKKILQLLLQGDREPAGRACSPRCTCMLSCIGLRFPGSYQDCLPSLAHRLYNVPNDSAAEPCCELNEVEFTTKAC
jgi:hypothetical protein